MNTPQPPKQCPRCKNDFECRVDDISQCQCSAVTLTDEERLYLSQHYNDCLCAKCMVELQSQYNDRLKTTQGTHPASPAL